MSFSDGKIMINNVPADDKGKPNTLTREVAGDKLTQVKNGPGFSILWRLHVKKLVFYIVIWFLSFYYLFLLNSQYHSELEQSKWFCKFETFRLWNFSSMSYALLWSSIYGSKLIQ